MPSGVKKERKKRRRRYNYFRYVKAHSETVVPFGDYFENGAVYESFNMSLSAKRAYNKNGLSIAKDNNDILNFTYKEKGIDASTGESITIVHNENHELASEFIYKYLSYKVNIDDNGSLTTVDPMIVISEILTIIDDDMIKLIDAFIDKYYEGSIDEKIDTKKHAFKLSTTYLDADVKQHYQVKFAANLLIPLCTHYCRKFNNVDAKDFFLNLYQSFFDMMKLRTGIDSSSKLHKYVEIITGTSFKSNQKIYDRMLIHGKTKDGEIEDNYSKILTTNITKIRLEDAIRVPAFIAKIIKNSSAQWNTRERDNYDVLSGFSDDYVSAGADDSIVTQAERMESHVRRPDEMLKVIRKNTCGDTISKISHRLGIFIEDPHEYEFALEHADLNNELARHFMFTLFSTYFGGYENMFDNNKPNYVRLMLICGKYLRKNGLDIIADFVASRSAGFNMSGRWGGRISDRKLYEDPRYDNLLNTKYKEIRAQFDRKNPIRENAVNMVNNNYKYNEIGDRFGTNIRHDDEVIIDEILKFYELLP